MRASELAFWPWVGRAVMIFALAACVVIVALNVAWRLNDWRTKSQPREYKEEKEEQFFFGPVHLDENGNIKPDK